MLEWHASDSASNRPASAMSPAMSSAQLPAEAARLMAANPQALTGIHASAQYAWHFARSTLIAWPYEQGSLSQVRT